MPILPRKLNRPIRNSRPSPIVKRGTVRRPIRKGRGAGTFAEMQKTIEDFAGSCRDLAVTAEEAQDDLYEFARTQMTGEELVSSLERFEEMVLSDLKSYTEQLFNESDSILDLYGMMLDVANDSESEDAEEDEDGEDVEASAKPRMKKRAVRPGSRRPLRKAGNVDIDTMLIGYMESALWSSTDESDDSGGEPLDRNYSPSDITDETKAKMRRDCEAFVTKAGDLLDKAEEKRADYIGHNFWLSRNGHGAGFFDKPESYGGDENADALQEVASSFGEYNLSVGDDGEIYGD